MDSDRKAAIIVGLLFIIALFTDIVSVSISENEALLMIVMLLDFISGSAVVGIGVTMFPILKPHNKSLALGYAGARIVEGALLIVGIILVSAGVLGSTVGIDFIYVYIFGIGALMFYYLLYQSKLIPRFISAWGLIAIIMLLVANSLGLLGSSSVMTIFFALPIILNELFLAIWLIVKGFNPSAIASESAKTDIN